MKNNKLETKLSEYYESKIKSDSVLHGPPKVGKEAAALWVVILPIACAISFLAIGGTVIFLIGGGIYQLVTDSQVSDAFFPMAYIIPGIIGYVFGLVSSIQVVSDYLNDKEPKISSHQSLGIYVKKSYKQDEEVPTIDALNYQEDLIIRGIKIEQDRPK